MTIFPRFQAIFDTGFAIDSWTCGARVTFYIIDPRPFQAAAEQARGQLSDAKSRTEFAELEYARATKLIATQAVSENVVDQRQQQLRQGQAAKRQAEGALQRALLDIEFAKITAPISGRIGRHLVGVGNLVDGSDRGATLLTSIVSLDPIYVYFDTTEANYMKYSRLWAEGKRPSSRDTANAVEVALAGEKKPSHPGAVDFVDNRMDGGTGTLRVRAVVSNHDLSILPGQFARVRLIGSAPYEALLLPELAIATDQSRRIVYVVKADDTVDVRTVELGPIDDGLRVVKSGIKADDRVVVEGLQRVRAGIKVAPKAAGEKEAAR